MLLCSPAVQTPQANFRLPQEVLSTLPTPFKYNLRNLVLQLHTPVISEILFVILLYSSEFDAIKILTLSVLDTDYRIICSMFTFLKLQSARTRLWFPCFFLPRIHVPRLFKHATYRPPPALQLSSTRNVLALCCRCGCKHLLTLQAA